MSACDRCGTAGAREQLLAAGGILRVERGDRWLCLCPACWGIVAKALEPKQDRAASIKSGIAAARVRGVKMGRKSFKLNPVQADAIETFRNRRKAALALGEKPPTFESLASALNISVGLAFKLGKGAV